MSFGFSVSDIIALTKPTTGTYNHWKKACGEHASITCDLALLKMLLKQVEVEAMAPDSLLTRNADNIECWRTLSKSCQSLVVELEDVLKKYKSLGTSRSGSRRKNWERIRSIYDDDLDSLSKEVMKRTESIGAFISVLGMGSQGRVENKMFPKLLQKMDHIAEQMRNGNASSSTAMTTYENDDKGVWRDFRREMINAGFDSSDIRQYSAPLKAYLARLKKEGLLDEKNPPDANINSACTQTPASESNNTSLSQDFSFRSADRPTSLPIFNTPRTRGGRQGLLSPQKSSGFYAAASFSSEEQEKLHAGRHIRGTDALGISEKVDEKGSPEWYIRQLMANQITSKELQSLCVSLRTQPIAWSRSFIDGQGPIALSNALSKINWRQGQGLALLTGSSAEKDLDREYNIIRCIRVVVNCKYGADNAIANPQIVTMLAGSLISPGLNNRKQVSEILTFLAYWADGQGHSKVVSALERLKTRRGGSGGFDAWMRIVEATVDGRGKVSGLDLESVRSSGIGMENLRMDYVITSLFLVNMIVDTPKDIQTRVHLRAQFKRAGIQRLLGKMEGFQYEVIDGQIARYQYNESFDNENLLGENNSMVAEVAEDTARSRRSI